MKKIISWLLVIATVATASIAGTVAYLTDRDSEANVFTVGDVAIELNEEFEQGAELIPGVDIKKEATITNTGKNDAWVWLTVLLPVEMGPYTAPDNMSASNNVVHWNYPSASAANITVDFNSTPVAVDTDGDGVTESYYQTNMLWKNVLPAGETTGVMLSKVYMDTRVDIDPDGDMYWVVDGVATDLKWNVNEKGNPVIHVSAYAIQSEGFETVQDAYDAYQTQWGNNGAEYGEPATVVTTAEEMEAALKAGSYVILGDDITIEKGIAIADGAVLDLNGFTLTDSSAGGRALGIQNGASFSVVDDGEIKKDDTVASTYAMPFYVSNGTLTVDGGTYNMGAPSEKDYSILMQNSSKVVINGGTFTNTANYPLFYALYSSELEINGGYFESIGTKNPDLLDVEYHYSRISTITIKGGTFVNYNPLEDDEGEKLDDARVVVAEGYKVVSETQENGDVWYTVVPADTEGLVDSVEEFKKALEEGGNIILTNDISITDTFEIIEPTNINMNGKTLTVNELIVTADTTLNNGTVKHGEIEYEEIYGFVYEENSALYVASGTLTLNDVKIEDNVPCTLKINNNSSVELVGIHIAGGACVMNDSTLNLTSDTVYGNRVQYEGMFGVCIDSGSLVMNNSSITFNGIGGRDGSEYFGILGRTDDIKTVDLNNTTIGENAMFYALSTGTNMTINTDDSEGSWTNKYYNCTVNFAQ